MTDFTVFGGSGYVGRHLVRYLESQGYSVLVPPRGGIPAGSTCLGHVIYAIGLTADFRRKPFETIDAHVSQAARILEGASFDSFLYLSSTRVYGAAAVGVESAPLVVDSSDSSDLYNLSKLLGESLTLHSERRITRVARLSNLVGGVCPSESFVTSLITEAQEGRIVLRSALASSKDYLHVEDAVRMLTDIALRGKCSIYNVASGVGLSHALWVTALRERFGCSVSVVAGAPLMQFPPISVRRFQEEFAYRPGPALRALDDLP
jgi:nucleoside-diphosphate-sugar epimerase